MKHKGTKTLKTERLLLRKFKTSDYKDVFRYASKDEVTKYVTWDTHRDPKLTKSLCKIWEKESKNENDCRWAIIFENRLIGCIDVVERHDKTAILGWMIDNEFWNKGIVTEAALAFKDFLFNEAGFEILEAAHIKENVGSGRVMQKIGMTQIPFEETVYFRYGIEFDKDKHYFYKLTK